MRKIPLLELVALAVLFLTACSTVQSPANLPTPTEPETLVAEDESQSSLASSDAGKPAAETADGTKAASGVINRRVDIKEDIYFPTLLPYDAIRPVYEPEFGTADQVPLDDEELIIGIHLNGESKAYSITVLRSREMVNDELGGLPILVTW